MNFRIRWALVRKLNLAEAFNYPTFATAARLMKWWQKLNHVVSFDYACGNCSCRMIFKEISINVYRIPLEKSWKKLYNCDNCSFQRIFIENSIDVATVHWNKLKKNNHNILPLSVIKVWWTHLSPWNWRHERLQLIKTLSIIELRLSTSKHDVYNHLKPRDG